MRIEEVAVYTLNELEKSVQERVIERYRNAEGFCWDSQDNYTLSEDFKNQLIDTMFEECNVEWSLSNCQGDGVMLVGEVDRDMLYTFLEASNNFSKHELRRIRFILDYSRYEMVRPRYYNSYFNTVDYTDCIPMGYSYSKQLEAELEVLLEDIEYLIKQEAIRLCRDFEKQGYESIDYNYSSTRIRDMLKDGYEFTEDGRDFI